MADRAMIDPVASPNSLCTSRNEGVLPPLARPVTDETDLVGQAQAGDRVAFDRLMLSFTPLVLGFLLGKTADLADAEDIAQETWLTAYRMLPTLRRRDQLGPWLMRIARRRLADFYRDRNRRPHVVWSIGDEGDSSDWTASLADPGADPARQAQEGQARAIVIESLAWLKDKYRTVLYLALFDECDAATIARRLGLRQGTVRMRLHRGLKLLRNALRRRGLNEYGSEETYEAPPDQGQCDYRRASSAPDGEARKRLLREAAPEIRPWLPAWPSGRHPYSTPGAGPSGASGQRARCQTRQRAVRFMGSR